MSEICFECWNKINNNEYSQKHFIISKDLDLCEECGKYKPVIITFRKPFIVRIFRFLSAITKLLLEKLLYKLRRKKTLKKQFISCQNKTKE